jgi:hypothetical protein
MPTPQAPEAWLGHRLQFRHIAPLLYNIHLFYHRLKRLTTHTCITYTYIGKVNKVLCHNICVLIASIYELGIEPTFASKIADAQKVA